MSDFPVIPVSRPKAVTHCSLLPIIAWAVVHGHWVDGGHRLWVSSRVTVARLWVGRVGRVPAGQGRRLPIAPLGRRARVQGVAVLIRRWGAGVGHGCSRAEGRPQLLGPGRSGRCFPGLQASRVQNCPCWPRLGWGSAPRPDAPSWWGGASGHRRGTLGPAPGPAPGPACVRLGVPANC